jgi:HSP20 family molecular chaperone IbpA
MARNGSRRRWRARRQSRAGRAAEGWSTDEQSGLRVRLAAAGNELRDQWLLREEEPMRGPEATVKPIIAIQRNVDSRRECLPLRDMADCLLQAYDGVARRAYKKFLMRGGTPGGELDDWLSAEHELLGNLAVDVEDGAIFVSALASLPGFTSEDVDVGIDPRWLVILGRHSAADRAERDEQRVDDDQIAEWASALHSDARTLQFHSRRTRSSMMRRAGEGTAVGANRVGAQATESLDSEALEKDSRGGTPSLQIAARKGEAEEIERPEQGPDRRRGFRRGPDAESEEPAVPTQLFCILELPTEVDPSRCVAVLANGLLGVRMPKRMK